MKEIINEEIFFCRDSYHIYGKSTNIYFCAWDFGYSNEMIDACVSDDNIKLLHDIVDELDDDEYANRGNGLYVNKAGIEELLEKLNRRENRIVKKIVSDVIKRYEYINALLKSFKYLDPVLAYKNGIRNTCIFIKKANIMIAMECNDYPNDYMEHNEDIDKIIKKIPNCKLYKFELHAESDDRFCDIFDVINDIGSLLRA